MSLIDFISRRDALKLTAAAITTIALQKSTASLPQNFFYFRFQKKILMLFLYHVHTFAGQLQCGRAKPGPCQQQVIVCPFEQ
jgi:hypothetical protein